MCKKDSRSGRQCDFLHEYNLEKMPVCQFWRDAGECNNPECLYLHIRPAESTLECPWYKTGFCRHGSKCVHKHIRRKACTNYLMGFCIEGPNCKFGHPTCLYKPILPGVDNVITQKSAQQPGAPGFEVTASGPPEIEKLRNAPVIAPVVSKISKSDEKRPMPAAATTAGYIPGMGS